jgi:ferrous iron transport protein B
MKKKIRVALAGNANVGKSVVFNYLTTLHQHIGNWPGKTIEKAEGSLTYKDYQIDVVDLPGIYSLRALSAEEVITRKHIAAGEADVVINVVDATVLERNLFLSLQLMQLNAPMVIALNMMDLAEQRGMKIDIDKLSKKLGVPVVPIVATQAKGITQMLEIAIEQAQAKNKPKKMKSGKAEKLYSVIEEISRESITLTKNEIPLSEKLDSVLLHRGLGYIALGIIALAIFYSIFSFGDFFSGMLIDFFSLIRDWFFTMFGSGFIQQLFWDGIVEGVVAAISIALPYLIPFYILLALLEDSGYLARMAFLMDGIMHKIGLHGKAFIPLMLGYGCTVPACLCCRIMETPRERLLAGFVVTLIPCAARTVIILGLVGAFVGIEWALGIYLLNLIVIFILGRIAFKALPGEPMGLIMEMPSYKIPEFKSMAKGVMLRVSSYVRIAFPIIVAATIVIKLIEIAGLFDPISNLLSPITVVWLGLPAAVGIAFVFGILRKELALIMLAAILGTENFAGVLSPAQMIVFTLVMMFYVPCAATIATLNKEYGWKKAAAITLFEIVFAIVLGGVALRILLAAGI